LPLDMLKEGARVEKNEEKKNSTDFALWKFSAPNAKRQMEWSSPWGVGFPGWHIECSAMSLKYLHGQLDIHCGGIDHINVHHTNEIAQSEAATGKKFFNFWLHGAFLNISGGKKMAKSDDNFLTLENSLVKKNISPLVYRFATLQTHYRKPMEYSEKNILQAQAGYNSLLNQVASLAEDEGGVVNKEYQQKFLAAINDDLNMPQALAVTMSVLKSRISRADRLATVLDFNRVLGLKLAAAVDFVKQELEYHELPIFVQELITRRQEARAAKDWDEADKLRVEIEQAGYSMEDARENYIIRKAD